MGQLFIDKYGKDTVVRALSWKQPFASLMLHGKVETRVWDSKYTGWVLICASKKGYTSREMTQICGLEQFNRIYSIFQGDHTNWSTQETGVAIAVGKLYSSESMKSKMIDPPKSIEDNQKNIAMVEAIKWACYVQPDANLYMHNYMDVQRIEPLTWYGKQGWSTLTEEFKSKIVLI